ncbi:MAG TPA: hypothetical protein VFQ07_10715, partial [Candidatus Polarisedimenticolia bacterium]|nr:hypothetical protein [Candidatus Polarisedimenticolia bacterium]
AAAVLRGLAVAGLFAGLLLGAPRPAFALGEWFGVELSALENHPTGTAAIEDDNVPGTTFDVEDTLGVTDDDTSTQARAWFRWGKRNRLFFDYFDANHEGNNSLSQPLVFHGTTFNAGEEVDTKMEMTLLQARYRYHFLNLKVFEFGLGFGINKASLKMDLTGTTTPTETLDDSVPFPSVAGGLVIKPLPGLHIRAEADWISASDGDDHADFLDYRAQIEWYFLHFFGVFGGYRSVHFDVETEDFGRADLTYAGPYAGLGVKF